MNPVAFAFLGPLVGAASRSLTGWMADRWGGARITIVVFMAMIAAVFGVLFFVGIKDQDGAFWGFLGMFLLLFAASGVGNASTFQMMPAIFSTLLQRKAAGRGAEAVVAAQKEAAKEGAAVLGFTSAVAAIGAFFIPKSFGSSIALSGGPTAALLGFIAFYVSCLILTWWYYTRRQAEVRLLGAPPGAMSKAPAVAAR